MPASEDDAGIPRVITARTPGYVPPKEYVQFLDMGGELAHYFIMGPQRNRILILLLNSTPLESPIFQIGHELTAEHLQRQLAFQQ